MTATEWVVAPGGTGSGTSTDPLGSIQQALNAAQPGDVITVAPGTYPERLVSVRGGTADARITLRAAAGLGTVIVTIAGEVMEISHPYLTVEGLVFDAQYALDDAVDLRSTASYFILRHSEVRRASKDCIDIKSPEGVLIEQSLVHHCLNAAGGRTDAHGIVAGAVHNLTIRDTDIHTFSGDGFQVDPGRVAPGWDDVLLERCRIWLEPLPASENGFPAGTVPGENAVDTKTWADGPRSRLTILDTLAWGFRSGLITNMAAFNLKEKVDATVDRVTVWDSEIAFRVRGATTVTPYGAWVSITNAVVHSSTKAVRYEDGLENFRLWNSTFGAGITAPFQAASADGVILDVKNLLLLQTALPTEAPATSGNLAVGNDQFVDAPAHDYHLTPGSIAADVGVAIGAITHDRDGRARLDGHLDVGAYELCAEALGAPSSLDFDAHTVGDPSEARTISVSNTGCAPLGIVAVALVSGATTSFEITADSCSLTTLEPGATCGIDVRYLAVVPGVVTAILQVSSVTGLTTAVTLTGRATAGVTISSFTPSFGAPGSSVTIYGTGFTGILAVRFNGSDAAFTVLTEERITATVPVAATTGPITVATASTSAVSAGTFIAAPRIDSFSPSSGIAGTVVVLTGGNFTGAVAVKFNGRAAVFTVNAADQIAATVPAGATTGYITVTTPAGTATSSTTFGLRPTVSSFSPSVAPAGGPVTIGGSNFAGATAVAFNGVPAVFTVTSATTIAATVPVTAVTGPVEVTTPVGTGTSTSVFKVMATISGFAPTQGAPGLAVILTGNTFTGATAVTFNGVTAVFSVNSNTLITATVPLNATTGPISVTTAAGRTTTAAIFTVAPRVSSFTPSNGPIGTAVVISGANFTGATAVTFNGVPASFTVTSATKIAATVPAAALMGAVAVTTPVGTGASTSLFRVTATISGFTPTQGVAGVAVVLTGTTFTGTTSVAFNGASAVFSVDSNTLITAMVPAKATTGPISVTTAGIRTTSAAIFTVAPRVSSFSPSSGPIGTSVVITGANFTGATAVTFNGVPAIFTVTSATKIAATVPAAALTGVVAVTTPVGTAASTGVFKVMAAIGAFAPTQGAPGLPVILTGTTFTGATAVTFNGANAVFSVDSSTLITATVPSNATTGPISVTTAAGRTTTAAIFTVAPRVSSFSPSSGPIGSSIVVSGANFTGATAVTFNGVPATFVVTSSTAIAATVPAAAVTGLVAVTTPAGTGVSTSAFKVTLATTALARPRDARQDVAMPDDGVDRPE